MENVTLRNNTPVQYDFTVKAGETYLSIGTHGAVAQFHLTMPDHEAESNLARKPLHESLRREETVQSVISGIVKSCSGPRPLSNGYNEANLIARNCAQFALTSKFRNFSSEVRLDRPITDLGPRRTHGVWARRTTIPSI